MSVSINRGGNPPKFSSIGMVRASGGITRSAIRLGDIDGDGRLDYCYLAANQDLYCFRYVSYYLVLFFLYVLALS